MAEAAARREARRRRILENADSRLKKISGITRNLEVSQEDEDKTNKENLAMNGDVKRDLSYAPEEAEECNVEEDFVNLEEKDSWGVIDEFHREPELLPETTTFVRQEAFPNPPVKPEGYTTFIILLLGISVRYINLIFDKFEYLVGVDLTFLHIDKIFIPLIGYEIYRFIFGKNVYTESPTFNLMLALGNINAKRYKPLLRLFEMVMTVLNDMALYFFAFIILDLVFEIFNV